MSDIEYELYEFIHAFAEGAECHNLEDFRDRALDLLLWVEDKKGEAYGK